MGTLDKFDIRGGDTGWYEVDRDNAENTINVTEVADLKKMEVLDGAVHVGSALTLTQMEKALQNLKASDFSYATNLIVQITDFLCRNNLQ